ncbi:MAG: hypothetical protein LBJ46_03750 [Planctomycetota bacterium]|jgi:hypothetical protein|nr:hypothetical protein [Planctomycetota bacterium]
MRMGEKDESASANRTKSGRALLVGFGLDDSNGHFRVTRADGTRLFGGSEATHEEMRLRADRILNELGRLGYNLSSITREQLAEVRRIVNRVSAE